MKRIYLITLLVALFLPVYSTHVSEDVAQTVARNFLQQYSRLKSGIILTGDLPGSYENTTTFYSFSISGGGWILISSDDAATPVLAYSNQGDWDEDSMNPAAKKWIESYSKEIYAAIQNRTSNEKSKTEWQELLQQQFSDAVTTVSPLLTTLWDQSMYYNALCPVNTSVPAGYGGRVPTGCVATAMAQIMKYYNYPAQGVGSYAYNSTYGALSANFGSTDYNWNVMPSKATGENAALATLLYHCGVSVSMIYDPTGSGAITEDVPHALKTYFNYDNGVKLLYKDDVASDEIWRSIIKTELDAGRPVYYAGFGSVGGHAFVCDGYDSSNPTKFHINWGWSGNSNGYFAIGALTTATGSFSDYNRIIVGIKPRSNPNYVCRISSPTDGSEVSRGSTIPVTVKTVKGNTTKVILYLDDVKKDSSITAPFNFSVNTSTLAVGLHKISIKATDGTNVDYNETFFKIPSSYWKVQNVPFSTDSLRISQIFPVDQNVVWAVAENGSSKNSVFRKFIKTDNGGTSWTEGNINCSTCSTLKISNIHALSATKAYACLNPGTATGGAILYTNDGGANWTVQTTADFTGSWANWVYFFDESNGVCMGDSYKATPGTTYNFVLYTTNNGGINWNKVSPENLPVAFTNEAGTVNFFDAVGNTIWFGTNNGRIFKSVDKGMKWTSRDGVLGTVQTNVRFKDAMNGYAFGGFGTDNYGFKKTTDGGINWQDAFPMGFVSGEDIEYVPGTNTTWVNSGYYSSACVNEYNVYFLLDDVNRISTTRFLSPTVGWGGGFYSVKNGGGIYKWIGSFNPTVSTSVVFRIKDAAGKAIQNASCTFNYQVKQTSSLGLASFNVISFGNPESYSVVKTGFSPATGNHIIKGPDTLDIVLRSALSVTFIVKNTLNEAVSGVTVTFDGRTQVTDLNGTTTFANVPVGSAYPYAATKSRFYAGYGITDVTNVNKNITVTLKSETTAVASKTELKNVVFPNPVSDILNVVSPNTITAIDIISTSGITVFSKSYSSVTVQVPVSDISAGEYILKVSHGKTQEYQKIIIKR